MEYLMTKKKILIVSLITLFLAVAIFLGFNIREDKMSQPIIPQEGIYEVSTHSFWLRTRGIDIILRVNSNVIVKAHDFEIFRDSGMLQSSLNIDSIIHNGNNIIEVYFKKLPSSMFSIDKRELIDNIDNYGSMYIMKSDKVYKDGKPYNDSRQPKVHIKFQLDEKGSPIITTPEGILAEKDLKIEPYENGYTKVTTNFILNNAKTKEWEKGVPYKSNQHHQLLENAYVDLWNILNQEDWGNLRKIYSIALQEAREQEPLISEATVYSMISPEDGIKKQGLRLIPMHPFSKYELETSNDGKLFRLVMYNDEGVKYSPIVFQNKEDEPEGKISIMPWFSVIDGKVQLTLPF